MNNLFLLLNNAKKDDLKDAIKKAINKYNQPEVKQALVEMFQGKCAYCESQIRIVDYGDIEHFCPKSKSEYTDLTFEWTNLLLSCTICNNSQHKGTNFPLDANKKPLLIDPTDKDTDIFAHLKLDWDQTVKQAWIDGVTDRGKTVVDIFDLNDKRGTRKELIRDRSKKVKTMLVVFKMATSETIDDSTRKDAINLLKESCNIEEPYLAFALFYILPFLAHHFQDLDAINFLKQVGQRSPSYSQFARINQLPD
ncbi:retron system putative HNH endonuclease [Planktothrix pseudagardhii]